MRTQEEIQKEFINNLFNLRRDKGITQNDIGLSPKAISQIENHKVDPKLSTVIEYMRVLRIDINDIFKKDKK